MRSGLCVNKKRQTVKRDMYLGSAPSTAPVRPSAENRNYTKPGPKTLQTQNKSANSQASAQI